jgi:hypothetical protein
MVRERLQCLTRKRTPSSLGFTHLPTLYWPILVVTMLAYAVLTQLIKVWLLRRKWI